MDFASRAHDPHEFSLLLRRVLREGTMAAREEKSEEGLVGGG